MAEAKFIKRFNEAMQEQGLKQVDLLSGGVRRCETLKKPDESVCKRESSAKRKYRKIFGENITV